MSDLAGADGAPDAGAVDRALVTAHVNGDPAAFPDLVRRHRDRLWAVALRTTGDREEAADALQEALVKAYRSAGSYRGEAAVTTWLHRIVVNACLDRLRRRAARPTVPLAESSDVRDPHDALDARETAMEIEAALAALPEDQRAALVLVDVHGLPVAEAADILGVPVGTVKSRCSRGRSRLAVTLAHLRNRPLPEPVTPLTPPTRPDASQQPVPPERGGER